MGKVDISVSAEAHILKREKNATFVSGIVNVFIYIYLTF